MQYPGAVTKVKQYNMPDHNELTTTNIRLVELGRDDVSGTPTAYFDLYSDEQRVGDIIMNWTPKLGEITVDAVGINDPANHGKGLATEAYKRLPHLSIDANRTFHEAGYKVVSSRKQTVAGKALWASLHRRGLAADREDGRFELIADAEPSEVATK